MDVYKSEDEQLEQAKRWLRENGPALLLGIVIALALVLGWRFWNGRQEANVAAAAVQYESLLQAAEQWSTSGDAAAATTAGTLAADLKAQHPKSGYADFAALLRARLALAEERPADAAAELEWVVERNRDAALTAIARYRLARVNFAQGQSDKALALLQEPPASFAPIYERLRGDILLAGGDTAAARAAYQQATQLRSQSELPADPILEIKLRDLQTNTRSGQSDTQSGNGDALPVAPATAPAQES